MSRKVVSLQGQAQPALYMNTNTRFLSHRPHFFLEREMCHTKVVEKIKTHILCSVTFLENRGMYEIKWKNFVELGRPHMTVWRIRISRWIPKATNIQSENIKLIAFLLQQWLQEGASMLRYGETSSIVKF
jgi:hypothetical protein